MEILEGYVESIIFHNKDNGYTVFEFAVKEKLKICVGNMIDIVEGESLRIAGEYTEHKSYGKQFQVREYTQLMPDDAISMERYLGSGAIKGLGLALAGRIVRRFGKDTFKIMEEEPERLAEIKGISMRKAMEISDQVNAKKELRLAMIFMQQYGISIQLALKIYKQYKEKIYQIVKENPYQLAEEIGGIGFKTADEIAKKIGIHTDSDYRIRSGIFHTLLSGVNYGHTYLPRKLLLEQAKELLEVEEEHIEKQLMDLAIDGKVIMKTVKEEPVVYAPVYYYMEQNVAMRLKALDIAYDMPEKEMEKKIQRIEKSQEVEFDILQKQAIRDAVTHGIMILTGGPGTGKTTTINGIIKYLELEQMDFALAAPTGRAAKRMEEMTGYEAKTIHRLLEVNGAKDGTEGFERNEENPLELDVVIVDEMSMVDIFLINALLKAVVEGTRLIFVGDENQLPSVGPGTVLKDMIESKQFTVVKLNKIFRQALQSDIVLNAHKIQAGEKIDLFHNHDSKDFYFLKRRQSQEVTNAILQLVEQKLPKYVNTSHYNIQVLTPMRKGQLGVINLNKILQAYMNPKSDKKIEIEKNNVIFREGDKVMQIKNNYQIEWYKKNRYGIEIEKGIGVFNGDIGIIEKINTQSEMLYIRFDEDRMVEYPYKMAEELEHAYAITIHKSQGSEYPAVVLPLLSGPEKLFNKNLLYTAITRAKKCVVIVGEENCVYHMIENKDNNQRYSSLESRIVEKIENFLQ